MTETEPARRHLATLIEAARENYQTAMLMQLRGLPQLSLEHQQVADDFIDTVIAELAARGL